METTIILTPIDVERFKKFQQHYELFALMDDKGIFEIGYGKCVLNFAGGVVQTIVREEVVYKK